MPRTSASNGWISSTSSSCQREFSVRRVCAPTLYCDRMRPVVRISGNLAPVRSSVATNSVIMKRPRPRTKRSTCIIGVPIGALSLQGHCIEPSSSSLAKETPAKLGVSDAISSMISDGWRVVHLVAQRLGEQDRALPVAVAAHRRHHLADAADAALGVGEGAVLLQERGARQEDVGVFGGLVQEQVLDDDALHRHQAGRDVVGVRVRLRDVLALDVEALEAAIDGLVEHVGDAQARLVVELGAPERLEALAGGVVRDVAVAGELVRERAHVAGALDVVLAAQRVHAGAELADVAGRHGDVGHAHHHGRALAVLGDAEAVVDAGVAAGGVEPGGGAEFRRIDAGVLRLGLRRVALVGDEAGPGLELGEIAALAHIGLVDQPLGDDHVRHAR